MSDQITIRQSTDPLGPELFNHTYRIAKVFSQSQLVPAHFQGHEANCMIAFALAHQLGLSPLLVMQNMYIVSGRPGFYSAFVIALVNDRGPFDGPIAYEETGSGDSLSVKATAKFRDSGRVVSAKASMKLAKAEAWTKNPKYSSMPEQMLSYRAAVFLARLYCPEVLMGFQTAEEVEDVHYSGRAIVVDQLKPAAVLALNDELKATEKKEEATAASGDAYDASTGELSPSEEAKLEKETAQ